MRVKDERLKRATKTVRKHEISAAKQMKKVGAGLKKLGASAKTSRLKERKKMLPAVPKVSASEYMKIIKAKKKAAKKAKK